MKNIAVVGTGYVGLVTGAGISDFGSKVCCLDIDLEKIKLLNNGKIPIYEPGLKDLIDRNIKSKRLTFSNDIEESINMLK